MSTPTRPFTLLIAALGGEGGGVLTEWIVSAASRQGLPVQSTSIPGVAQRTGATTYYVEIVPTSWGDLGDRRPVLALTPGAGDIDVVLASELMEAGRAVAGGFVTPDRTLMIASTSRFYVMNEKVAMGDGRYDQEHLTKAIHDHAQDAILFDMAALAAQNGALISAVMLGALAGSGRLPIPSEALEEAIRADGKAVESNLRGFRAGQDAARARAVASSAGAPARSRQDDAGGMPTLERRIMANLPEAAHEIAIEGVRRLTAYQSAAYAQLYLDRLERIRVSDPQAAGRTLAAIARHLAVRMSFEDVIRVAQAKIEPARMRRILGELKTGDAEPVVVVDFLKPGIEEMCQILPSSLARPILARAERSERLRRLHWGMEIKSTSVSGYLRFLMLAKLRRWRPFMHRYREEQAAIEAWLGHIAAAATMSPDLAVEIAECARLIKGYGDTHKRGSANYRQIETALIVPALAGRLPLHTAIDALSSARTAALVDPDGEGLSRCLADIERQSSFSQAAE